MRDSCNPGAVSACRACRQCVARRCCDPAGHCTVNAVPACKAPPCVLPALRCARGAGTAMPQEEEAAGAGAAEPGQHDHARERAAHDAGGPAHDGGGGVHHAHGRHDRQGEHEGHEDRERGQGAVRGGCAAGIQRMCNAWQTAVSQWVIPPMPSRCVFCASACLQGFNPLDKIHNLVPSTATGAKEVLFVCGFCACSGAHRRCWTRSTR